MSAASTDPKATEAFQTHDWRFVSDYSGGFGWDAPHPLFRCEKCKLGYVAMDEPARTSAPASGPFVPWDEKSPCVGRASVDLRERYQWKRVEAPRAWRPRMLGEELVGFYGGKTVRNGQFGQYEVVIVHVPARGTFTVSGARIVQLLDASGIEPRWPVRVVWRGRVPLEPTADGEVREMKQFEVFVAEGDPVAAEDMPLVRE